MSEPSSCDVLIVGAGIVGACTAYWLTRLDPSLAVTLVERDLSFDQASSSRSASSIRQQFSTELNIRMSQFGWAFLRDAPAALRLDDAPGLDLGLREQGYLYLADSAAQAAQITARHRVQGAAGADIDLMTPSALRQRFGWLNCDDLLLGAFGRRGEGWFDGPALHRAVLAKARAQGARLHQGQVTGIELDPRDRGAVRHVRSVALADGRQLACRWLVNAAGPWAGQLASLAGLTLPLAARRRTVFVLSCPQPLPGCPLVIDSDGSWFRPEGSRLLAGRTPAVDADQLPLDPDLTEFDQAWWARLAHRVPAFEALRVERAWAGYYDMNLFDHNALIGPHPWRPNLLLANGFSGHGVQHAPAAGRGLAEWVLDGRWRSLDLGPLGVQRLLDRRPLTEDCVIG